MNMMKFVGAFQLISSCLILISDTYESANETLLNLLRASNVDTDDAVASETEIRKRREPDRYIETQGKPRFFLRHYVRWIRY